jgi:hypothetical protein
MTATATWLIARREIRARWIMWPVALVLAGLAVAVPRIVGEDDGLAVANAIWISAWVVPCGVSVIVGTTLLGGEHGEGRLAFYFARPIAAWQIFAGKLLGGLVLAVVAQAIFVVLACTALPGSPPPLGVVAALAVLAALAGVPFGLAAGLAARARTPWLALDIAGLVAIVVALALGALRPLLGHIDDGSASAIQRAVERAIARAELLAIAGLAIMLLALLCAGGRAIASGRSELARSHAVLSRTLWAIALPACAVVVAIACVMDV